MNNQTKEIANRLEGLREALEMSVDEMAAAADTTAEQYNDYIAGKCDIPVSFLCRVSEAFNVELTTLFSGEEPRMKSYFVTRKGRGVKVEREEQYSYRDLASGFSERLIEPFMVTVEPEADNHVMERNSHQGQEFNYIIEGTLQLYIDDAELTLYEGDSVIFDSQRPHGMRAVGARKARYIAVLV